MEESALELAASLPAADTPHGQAEAEELGRVISRFLRAQKEPVRVVFLRRYWYADSVEQAAALAAAVCIMGATGVLERALLMTGVDIVRTPHRAWVSFRFAEAPYTVEGERVYFTADGQHTDITAQIDENIPYIYETEHEGRPTWLMVGGAPGALGWAEVWAGREAVEVAFQAGGGSGVLNLDAQRLRERIWRELLGDVSWLSAGLDAIQGELEALLPEP
ncbi:MAG TPA: hypothetical protein H9941_05590 [Candidatus Flavonifractor avistercoris]|nr:hypothetical protein [Candidatus Flavonifractor avistercoris]